MITEDYCSFEIAKLLKEKGFNEYCFALYDSNKKLIQSGIRLNNIQVRRVESSYSAPTLQMVMKWLREKNIDIVIMPLFKLEEDRIYCYEIHSDTEHVRTGQFKTYEEAVEAALKYALENIM